MFVIKYDKRTEDQETLSREKKNTHFQLHNDFYEYPTDSIKMMEEKKKYQNL